MHQLFLLRHAKAEPAGQASADHDRALSPAGWRAATATGRAMRHLGLVPDVVLVSSSTRTQQTLEALNLWDEQPNIETMPGLYMASAPVMFEMIRRLAETMRSVMIIGHNPGLHELALNLASTTRNTHTDRLIEDFPTAALAEFFVTTAWQRLAPANLALTRFLRTESQAATG